MTFLEALLRLLCDGVEGKCSENAQKHSLENEVRRREGADNNRDTNRFRRAKFVGHRGY